LRRGFETVLEGEWIERVTGLSGVRARCVFLEGSGDVRIELLQYESPEGSAQPLLPPNAPGLRHFAIEVEDLDDVVRRLTEAGAPLISEPVEVPFPVGSRGRKRLCYFRDPDGVLVEAAAYG
jgi:catechol 2,3-dioxygenase-like lactoylglutathione lyase family enzyme